MGELSQVNILLVDDNPNNLTALIAVLERPEYNLITAASGKEALGLLLQNEFAIVLLDVSMPEMDGYAVATAMKQLERTRFIPIIFVTAIANDIKDIYRGYATGGVDYLQKPLEAEIVRAKVSVFVELFQVRKEVQRQSEVIRNSERAQHLEREQAGRIRAEAAERRYYDLINWVDHAVLWEYDPIASKFLFVSQRSLEILGYSPSDWISDPSFFVKHIYPQDRQLFEDMLEVAIEQGRDGRCEHRFYRSDGETLWVHSGVNPRKNSKGEVTLLWGLTLDITGFKSAEVNQRFLAKASSVLSSSLDYAVTLEKVAHLVVPELADGCIVDVVLPEGAPRRISVVHRSLEKEKAARELRERYPLKPGHSSPVLKVIETGKPELWRVVTEELLARSVQNEEHLRLLKELQIESLMIVPLLARDKILGAVSLISSDPDRRFNEKDLNFAQELAWHMAISIDNSRLYDDSKRAIRVRDDVLGIVSHDLKGPLTAIGMSAQLLLKRVGSDSIATAERILRSAEAMGRLISDLLDLSKIEAGHLSLERKSCLVTELIEDVVETLAPIAEKKMISIRKSVPDSKTELTCDRDRIAQVLSNIVGNAIKFTPEKGKISIGVKVDSHEILFWISDSGPGIRDEELSNIFERYWQARASKKIGEGSGLGLFIAKRMIEAHQGRIWVNNNPDHGSTFYFTIPSSNVGVVASSGAA